MPYVFTQEGIAMLSSVLRSPRAIQMNIGIMRAFVRLRQIIGNNRNIAARVQKLERNHDRTVSVIEILVDDLDQLSHEVKEMKALPPAVRRRIGFHPSAK